MTSVHPPFDTRIFYKECKALVEAGYAVTLIAQHEKDEVVDCIKIVILPKAKNRIHRMFGLTLKAFWFALGQKADIYHFHDPELLPVGALLKLFRNKKVIYDVHEDYRKQMLSKPYIPKIVRGEIALLVKIIEYLFSKIFDGIITATDDILMNFSYYKRAISVKNFPIVSIFANVKIKNNNKRNIFNLVYIGGLAEIRGVTQIVRALELVDSNEQLRLTLYGKFSPANYESKVRGLKGFEKVEYKGWIKFYDIPILFKNFDAGIVCLHPIPNYITALPVKLFEYMAAGLPVIASNFPLYKEIIEGNRCGLTVNPVEPKEIAAAIEYLIEHPAEAKKMGENGRKAVLEKYNWEVESKKLLKLYEELCEK